MVSGLALTLSVQGIELHHLAYPAGGGAPYWAKVCGLQGSIGPGQVIRIHSGDVVPTASLALEDRTGADFHAFTSNRSFVWNNAEGDTSGLWRPSSQVWIDKASYDPYPPEGVVLKRSGTKLVASAAQYG